MKINYNNRVFSAESNSPNGQVDEQVRFYYYQKGDLLTGRYEGGSIMFGQIIGKIDAESKIEMRYQHLDNEGVFRTGICHSSPEITEDNKVRIFESWQWTNGDLSKGTSTLIEIR